MIINETLKIIKQRRSIRSFKDEQIKEEELQAILDDRVRHYYEHRMAA